MGALVGALVADSWGHSWTHSWGHSWAHSWVEVRFRLFCASSNQVSLVRTFLSEPGPPQFQEKLSRSERAILGALGEFRGILGAALGIGNSILGIRNSILGMASHDWINTKPTILGATLGAIPGIAANPPERF